MVESQPSKLLVAGSIPVSRSIFQELARPSQRWILVYLATGPAFTPWTARASEAVPGGEPALQRDVLSGQDQDIECVIKDGGCPAMPAQSHLRVLAVPGYSGTIIPVQALSAKAYGYP